MLFHRTMVPPYLIERFINPLSCRQILAFQIDDGYSVDHEDNILPVGIAAIRESKLARHLINIALRMLKIDHFHIALSLLCFIIDRALPSESK